MKLRNKETGKVQTCDMVVITDEKIDGEIASLNKHTFIFRSIEQFNDEYEAYEPKEPLIEKRSHRGVLRAAAQMSGTSKVHVCRSDCAEVVLFEFNGKKICSVELRDKGIHVNHDGWYTIAELCGEEEE